MARASSGTVSLIVICLTIWAPCNSLQSQLAEPLPFFQHSRYSLARISGTLPVR